MQEWILVLVIATIVGGIIGAAAACEWTQRKIGLLVDRITGEDTSAPYIPDERAILSASTAFLTVFTETSTTCSESNHMTGIECLDAANILGRHIEDWACEHLDFDDFTGVWVYDVEEAIQNHFASVKHTPDATVYRIHELWSSVAARVTFFEELASHEGWPLKPTEK